ncbi:MAG: alanine--tRNA ligase [Candidatus Melainabacteria bacterium]|nr:alanine--tRNA ligase [Candidatus Melainabacteria bacterium]
MGPATSKEIRESWISFFSKEHGHTYVKSSSLIPDNPTLLLTGAGMVQFVPYFLDLKEPEFKRAATIQKCTRVGGKDSDLENIGRTTRHHSFFEMLGNFSFGDYFKSEAISWAWDYVTKILSLPKEKLIVSVFKGDKITPFDSEAYDLWKKLGLDESKIKKLGRKDVFWGPPGPTGPCGPCSEIYFDRGPDFKDPDERYLEIWNLVFMEFEKDEEGKIKLLAKKNIDTGAGLERIALILQSKPSTFETDLLKPILDTVCEITKGKSDLKTRIITDHIRCICFLIADGIRPSNLGRGYVLRMLIRRAARFGYLLGMREPFLYKLPGVVTENYSVVYTELLNINLTIEVVKREEEKFLETIERGLVYLDNLFLKPGKIISGEDAFNLYSTYGFPVELTIDIAKEKDKEVNLVSFETAKEKHSEVSNKDVFAVKLTDKKNYGDLLKELGTTQFLGYEVERCDAKVLAILNSSGERVEKIKEGESGEIILDKTVFYAESGGQVGDIGIIRDQRLETIDQRPKVIVTDTQKFEGLFMHHVQVKSGEIKIGDNVSCEIDLERRTRTKHHHSATHLMHSALRKIFGETLQQAGSEVNYERTRFDFTLDRGAKPEEIKMIEDMVNNWIQKKLPVEIKEMSFDDAIKTGALAFFGDKYGDFVRVIKMGDEKELASVEFCGGTHVKNTSEIGEFKIIKESSISAGTRRIEAVSGEALREYMVKQEKERELKSQKEKELEVKKIQEEKKTALSLEKLKMQEDKIQKLPNDVLLFIPKSDDYGSNAIKIYIENKIKSETKLVAVIVNVETLLATSLTFYVGITKDLIQKGLKAKELVNKIAEVTGGRGGGRDDFAQAGGKDISRIEEALKAGQKFILLF